MPEPIRKEDISIYYRDVARFHFGDKADEFLERAVKCSSADELSQLVSEYVEKVK